MSIAIIGLRLMKLLPVLASDKSGEVVAAAAAITRTLNGAGLDWHAVVAVIAGEVKRQRAPPFTFANLAPRTARKQIAALMRVRRASLEERVRMEQVRIWLHGQPTKVRLPTADVAFLDALWSQAFGAGASQ